MAPEMSWDVSWEADAGQCAGTLRPAYFRQFHHERSLGQKNYQLEWRQKGIQIDAFAIGCRTVKSGKNPTTSQEVKIDGQKGSHQCCAHGRDAIHHADAVLRLSFAQWRTEEHENASK